MRIFIACRAWVDWNSKEVMSEVHNHTICKRIPRFLRFVDLWNEAFSLNYFKTRYMIAQLAVKNWNEVIEVDGVYERVRELFPILKDGDVILPTDDDDWYSPNIAKEIRELDQKEDLIPRFRFFVWNEIRIQAKQNGPRYIREHNCRNPRITTNAYGLRWRKSEIRKCKLQIKNHSFVDKRAKISKRRNKKIYVTIEKWLACNNKTLLSLATHLYARLGKKVYSDREKLVNIVENCSNKEFFIDGEAWPTKWYEGLRDIYSEVLESKKI